MFNRRPPNWKKVQLEIDRGLYQASREIKDIPGGNLFDNFWGKKMNKLGFSRMFLFLFVFTILYFNFTGEALFSRGQAHTRMTNDALKIMPKMPEENQIFAIYLSELKAGILDPDKNRVIEHTNVAACGMMIDRLAKECERMIKKNEDWSRIMFTLGQATHYVEDLNTPFHCIKVSKNIHEEFEKAAVEGHWQEDSYKGFYYIKDYINFAYNICNFSERYVPFIEKWYFKSDPELLKKMMVPLWANTVQDIVDFWLNIFRNGFGEQKYYKELGLPEPVGAREEKEVKFEKIKDL